MNYLCMNNSNMNDSSFNRKKQLFLVVKTFKKFTCDNNNLQKKKKKSENRKGNPTNDVVKLCSYSKFSVFSLFLLPNTRQQ